MEGESDIKRRASGSGRGREERTGDGSMGSEEIEKRAAAAAAAGRLINYRAKEDWKRRRRGIEGARESREGRRRRKEEQATNGRTNGPKEKFIAGQGP